jgi:hypothetical protein
MPKVWPSKAPIEWRQQAAGPDVELRRDRELPGGIEHPDLLAVPFGIEHPLMFLFSEAPRYSRALSRLKSLERELPFGAPSSTLA